MALAAGLQLSGEIIVVNTAPLKQGGTRVGRGDEEAYQWRMDAESLWVG